MSLDSLESEIASLRSQAAEITDDYARTQHEISSDPNLTEAGKAEALAPLHETLRDNVTALHQREKEIVRTKRESLERALYGTTGSSADIVSFRDAQSIATRITDHEEAHETYTNALRSDDKVLARAIFQRATTQGWDKVLKDHLNRNPSVKPTLADLEAIRRYEQNTLETTVHYMTPTLNTNREALPPTFSAREMGSFFSGGRR